MMTCSDLGAPPGCSPDRVTNAECEAWSIGLQDRFGEPPLGAYFWPRRDVTTGAWTLSLCYDTNNDAHMQYATLTAGVRE